MTCTIERLRLAQRGGHRFLALADLLEEAIALGDMPAGTKLPPQRDLANRVGVTVGTVGRAYDLLHQRGLVAAHVGRGTFVLGTAPKPEPHDFLTDSGPAETVVDLRLNRPNPLSFARLAAEAAAAVAAASPAGLLAYPPTAGTSAGRAAAAAWLDRHGVRTAAADVVLTNGCQGGLHLALAQLSRPGDGVMAAGLSYTHFQDLTRLLHLRAVPIAFDDDGLDPESLERQAVETGAKIVLLNPNLQNPTATVMSEARRRAIAAVAQRLDLQLIEDDVYGLLLDPAPPPIQNFAPERTVFITSVSKTLAPGLRLGFLTAPNPMIGRIADAHHSLALAQPVLPVTAFAAWLESGLADRIVAEQRQELAARHGLAESILGDRWQMPVRPSSHLWLDLPSPWRAAALVERLAQHDILVVDGVHFLFGRGRSANAIRVVLAGTADRGSLETALRTLVRIVDTDLGRSALLA